MANQSIIPADANAIASVRFKLPTEMREPILQRLDPAAQPIVQLALSSKSQSHAEISRLAEDQLADKLRALPGVAVVTVGGALKRELSILLRADKLREVTDGHDGTWVAHPGLVPVAREIFDLVDTLNDEKEAQQKRWGVRPHKVSLFTAYDFRGGRLAGLTAGGGWRWRSRAHERVAAGIAGSAAAAAPRAGAVA